MNPFLYVQTGTFEANILDYFDGMILFCGIISMKYQYEIYT